MLLSALIAFCGALFVASILVSPGAGRIQSPPFGAWLRRWRLGADQLLGSGRSSRRERRSLQRQLRASSELVAALAHELRSPLQGVLGMAEVLSKGEPDPERKRLLGDMRRSALHMLHVTDDSLELARLQHQQPQVESRPFRLETVLADVVAGCRPLRAAQVELAVTVSHATASHFEGDPDRLRQILTNLMTNSLARTRTGHVLLTAAGQADGLELSVQDSGPGIPQRLQGQLSAPFAQGRGSPGKAGMGLAIAGGLVNALGGQLSVHSQSGEGASFWARIPFAPLAEPSTPAFEQVRRVGLAEESLLHRHIVLGYLEHWNMAVTEFETATAIGDWLQAPTQLHALVISLEWFERSGVADALCRHCRQHGVILIVHGDPDDPAYPTAQEASSHLWPRPLLAGELAAALAAAHASPARQPGATPRRPGRVLVVDDNPLVRTLLADTVTALGCSPVMAHDGQAAIRAAEFGAGFDLVLLDRNMPGSDGLHTARALRQQPATQDAKLVLLVNDDAEAAAVAAGSVDQVLIRPRGREALERGLRALLHHQQASTLSTAAPMSRDVLENSLREDLERLAQGVTAGDAAVVRDQIHRLRGALRLFPVQQHERWLHALTSAAADWDGTQATEALRNALTDARKALEP